ncbi:hypothetical protein [Neolewinella xylanilytica]|uniref:hypothetical protein n=1 Tax=Neolewinella xylanilytica TaxID=1514080 RepID=UPI0011AFD61C|nr:hypothetical protein [Neolewinella xylanilytica]
MALPKKGIRKITVGTTCYYWTVSIDYQSMKTFVGIGLVDKPNKHITLITTLGKDDHNESAESYFYEVKPSLVRRAIIFANNSDTVMWNGKKDSKLELIASGEIISICN